jgi:UDP-N-acetylglucosamine--N-acetylmuramyl-(pentapeptide) pyrophosphoryl-undecaprenol N-acetylglucosamine transferase
MYVGFAGGIEERAAPQASIPLVSLRLTTPDRPLRTVRASVDLVVGILRCVAAFRAFSPQALFSTGGFVSVPATCAAWLLRRPIVMFLPDARPGTTVKLLSWTAKRVAVSIEDSLDFLPNRRKASVTGYPVRPAFLALDRPTARARMDLADKELQLLVLGGSLGAASINRSVAQGLNQLLALARVVHVCGPTHIAEMTAVRDRLPDGLRERYKVRPYLEEDEIATAMFASDLAITRGGASVLGELPAAGLPAIIVPLPSARVGQAANAEALQSRNACLMMANHHAESGELITTAEKLLKDHLLRESMARAMVSLRRPSAAHDIATIVVQVARPDG